MGKLVIVWELAKLALRIYRSTTLSWIFYYKALKIGDVATVALIDKGSLVVAILLAWLLLKEVITLRIVLGAAVVIAKKP